MQSRRRLANRFVSRADLSELLEKWPERIARPGEVVETLSPQAASELAYHQNQIDSGGPMP